MESQCFPVNCDQRETVALSLGDISEETPVCVRMHSLNPFEDILGMDHPRTGQLQRAMSVVEEAGAGIVVLFPGLVGMRPSQVGEAEKENKEQGTLKDYGIGAQILRELGVRHMILLTNSPSHIVGLEGYGLDIVEQREIPG